MIFQLYKEAIASNVKFMYSSWSEEKIGELELSFAHVTHCQEEG